jgi:trehalose 6-phosphate synthase/phosphatase
VNNDTDIPAQAEASQNQNEPSFTHASDTKNISTLDMETLTSVSSQFHQYSMDDVEMGTIHGDGGKEASLWAAYTAVNRKFADAVVQCFNEGDLIWIHGFHLMILPSFLTRRIPMAKVGLFLHTPFPSSEIFRTLWCREDLLRGMLNADQVGFHLFEYARHFLTCCRRLLGLRYGMIPDEYGGHNLAIETNGRHVGVTSIHAGIEPPILNQVLNHPSTAERVDQIRNQFKGKIIFCAIDRLESLKGIPLKMLGLERFLHQHPEWVGKIVLIQFGISAYERGNDYVRTRSEVLSMVASINKMWPGTVQFQERSEAEMRLPQRMALMRASDVIVVTPIRDGLNLIPLEYTIAHLDYLSDQGRRDGRIRGLCILSEFSSCARVMRGALHVNPWKIGEIADSFHQALSMSEDERIRRITTASEFVTRVTTQRWALAVLLDLKAIHKSADVGKYSGAGLGLGYRLVGMETGFNSLDTSAVAKAYKDSHSRLILLDYGGTILSNDNVSHSVTCCHAVLLYCVLIISATPPAG